MILEGFSYFFNYSFSVKSVPNFLSQQPEQRNFMLFKPQKVCFLLWKFNNERNFISFHHKPANHLFGLLFLWKVNWKNGMWLREKEKVRFGLNKSFLQSFSRIKAFFRGHLFVNEFNNKLLQKRHFFFGITFFYRKPIHNPFHCSFCQTQLVKFVSRSKCQKISSLLLKRRTPV